MKIGVACVLTMVAIAFTILIHHETTQMRWYAFSTGCEDYLDGNTCHQLADKYIKENPTWGTSLTTK